VSSNGNSAELGRAGGGAFNVVTNSGGNRWHGAGCFYARSMRDQRMAAASRTSTSGSLVEPSVASHLTTDVASFAANFQTLYTEYRAGERNR